MPRTASAKLSETELRELYAFVESGYSQVTRHGPVRRAIGKIARAVGLPPADTSQAADATVTEYDSPLDAAFVPFPGVFTVPVSWLRNHLVFGHGPGAFNAWEATVRQLASDPNLDHRDTILARFYDVFRPQTVAELSFADPDGAVPRSSQLWQVKLDDYMYDYPWSPHLKPWPGHVPPHLRLKQYGPVGDEIVQLEVWRLRRLIKSITDSGFRPLEASGTRGYLLKVGGNARFIVKGGFHRAATLAGLGYTDIPVLFSTTSPRIISLDSLERWPLVRNGMFEPAVAEKLAYNLTTDGGADRARSLGFEPHP